MAALSPCDPGQRDRLIELQQLLQSTAASRLPVEAWTTLDAVFAKRTDLTGREQFQFAQVSASADTRWEIGYRGDMDPELVNVPKLRRVSYQGRAYDIVSASMIGRRAGIELITLSRAD